MAEQDEWDVKAGELLPWNVEELSSILHDIYQKEAHRRGDVRHNDDYNKLAESTKEWDRVLARWILELRPAVAAELRAQGQKIEQLKAQLGEAPINDKWDAKAMADLLPCDWWPNCFVSEDKRHKEHHIRGCQANSRQIVAVALRAPWEHLSNAPHEDCGCQICCLVRAAIGKRKALWAKDAEIAQLKAQLGEAESEVKRMYELAGEDAEGHNLHDYVKLERQLAEAEKRIQGLITQLVP